MESVTSQCILKSTNTETSDFGKYLRDLNELNLISKLKFHEIKNILANLLLVNVKTSECIEYIICNV